MHVRRIGNMPSLRYNLFVSKLLVSAENIDSLLGFGRSEVGGCFFQAPCPGCALDMVRLKEYVDAKQFRYLDMVTSRASGRIDPLGKMVSSNSQ